MSAAAARRSLPLHPSSGPATIKDGLLRPISYLRISLTDRCNYRCTYCMPEDGVSHVDKDDILSFEEICDLVRAFALPRLLNPPHFLGEVRDAWAQLMGVE